MRINRISPVSLSIRILQFRFGILVVAVAIVNVRTLVPVHLVDTFGEGLRHDGAVVVLAYQVAVFRGGDAEVPIEQVNNCQSEIRMAGEIV